jgi:PAS domain S-box-containing protein/putative nucleotidyltransferase with HDIG domain
VKVAASGEKALAIAASGSPPDLILLDIMMPEMDGYEVARRLKAKPATANIPIIMVTAHTDQGSRVAGLNAGAEDFLSKPVDPVELGLRVRNLLRLKAMGDLLQQHNQKLEQEVRQRVSDLHVFRHALDATVDGISLVSRNSMRFVEANTTICNMLGYTRGELFELGPANLVAVPVEQLQVDYDALIAGHGTTPSIAQLQMRRKDGSEFPAEVRRHAYAAPTGWIIVGVVCDITARQLAEQTLSQENLRNQAFLRHASDGVHILDESGEVQDVSDSFCTMLGYSREELIGANVSLWDSRWSAAELPRVLAAQFEKEDGSVFETRHRRKDGTIIEVEISCQPLALNGQTMLYNSAREVTEKKRAEQQILDQIEQLKIAFMSTVEVATTICEMRDPYTAGHERRVANIAAAIGIELGLDAHRQEGLRVAGHLHDIGKISVPSEILSKPGKLSPTQLKLIQEHAQAGYDILKSVEFPWPVAEVALQHHERIDGSGYPQGLKGEDTLLEARIMAVADVVEAMSSHRPYRAGLGIDKALAEIERGRATVYDVVVADACLKLFREKAYSLPE